MFHQDTHKSKLKTLKILVLSMTQMHPDAFLPHKGKQSHMQTFKDAASSSSPHIHSSLNINKDKTTFEVRWKVAKHTMI